MNVSYPERSAAASSQSTSITSCSTGAPVVASMIATASGLDRDDLAVVRELHAARLGEERREVRGEEVLAVAEPDDHRGLVTHADEVIRMVVVDDDEGEVPLEACVGAAHGFDEVAVVGVLEQVRDDLGVGLGAERVAGGEQLVAQLAVVLDDPVQHDRELAVVARLERMRVLPR